jgi:hypothetical protein
MDLQTMRQFVLTHEDLEAEDLEETLLDGWANEAFTRIHRLVASWPRFDSTVSLATVAGTSAYDHGLKRVETIYGDNGLIEWIGHVEAQRKYLLNGVQTGRPYRYSTRGSQVHLWPQPDAVYTLTLEGKRVPTPWPPLTGAPGSEPDLPEDFHRLILSWMLHRALLQQDDGERAQAELSHYQSLLGELITDEVRADLAEPLIIGGRRRPSTYPPGTMPYDVDTLPS